MQLKSHDILVYLSECTFNVLDSSVDVPGKNDRSSVRAIVSRDIPKTIKFPSGETSCCSQAERIHFLTPFESSRQLLFSQLLIIVICTKKLDHDICCGRVLRILEEDAPHLIVASFFENGR